MRTFKKIGLFYLFGFLLLLVVGCDQLPPIPTDGDTTIPQITSITIDQDTVLDLYPVGEIDLSLIDLIIHKSDGTTETIPLHNDMLSTEDLQSLLVVGTHDITINYLDLSVQLSITIIENIPINQEIRISFISNGGSNVNQITILEGETISQYPTPIKKGSEFEGWYLDAALTQKANTTTIYTSHQTLYAKWERIEYKIYYITNTEQIIEPVTCYYNDSIVIIIPDNVDDMTFDGWYDSSDLTTPNPFTNMPDHDVYLYAKWIMETFNVSFESNGGSHIDNLQINKNDVINGLSTPVKEGYLFMGWFYDSGFTLPVNLASPIVTDIVLYASWEVDPSKTYTLKYYTYDDLTFERLYLSKTNSDYYFRGYLISTDQRIFAWGNNQSGLLGIGHSDPIDGLVDITSCFHLFDDEFVTDLAVGQDVTVAITNHERLFVWGFNDSYQLTSAIGLQLANAPQDITNELDFSPEEQILKIETAQQSVYVITSLGRILTWGANSLGELGNGTNAQQTTYTDIQSQFQFQPNEQLVDIKAGFSHVVAYTNLNRVFTWGSNFYGQLGIDSHTDTFSPQDITNRFNFQSNESVDAIETGYFNSFLTTSQSRLFGFGRNEGEFGNGTRLELTVPTELYFPFSIYGDPVVSMDAADKHIMITTESGRVITSGNLTNGQLGDNQFLSPETQFSRTFLDISDHFKLTQHDRIVYVGSSSTNSYAISSEGKFFAWGKADNLLIPNNVSYVEYTSKNVTENFILSNDETIIQMQQSNGEEQHYLAITSKYRIYAWGNNRYGQLGFISQDRFIPYPVDITDQIGLQEDEYVIEVACGEYTSYVLTNLKRVISFGYSKNGQAGSNVTTMMVKPTDVTPFFTLDSLDTIEKVYAIERAAYVITEKGQLYGWGQYQLGDGTSTMRKTPINLTSYFSLSPQETIVDIYGSENTRFVVTNQNRLFVWGDNTEHQLGFPSLSTITTPVFNYQLSLNQDESILQIYCGSMHTFILTSDYRVLVMGRNPGQSIENATQSTYFETPTDITSLMSLEAGEHVISMVAGTDHTIILTSEHRVLSFGDYRFNGLGTHPSPIHNNAMLYDITNTFMSNPLDDVVALFGSLYSHFVVTSEHQVYSWGRNQSGQLANGYAENMYIPTLISIQTYVLFKEESYHINEDVILDESYQDNSQLDGWYVDQDSDEKAVDFTMNNHDVSLFAKQQELTQILYHTLEDIQVESVVTNRYSGTINYTFILTKDHRVFAWGNAQHHMLIVSDDITTPIEITDYFHLKEGEYIVKIAPGWNHVIALTNLGHVYTHGGYSDGQLGYTSSNTLFSMYNDESNSFYFAKHMNLLSVKPYQVTDLLGLQENEVCVDVFGMDGASVILTNAGRVIVFGKIQLPDGTQYEGYNALDISQLFQLEEDEVVISYQQGYQFHVVLTNKGRVLTYGKNTKGQLGNGTGIDQSAIGDITSNFTLEEDDYIAIIYVGNDSVIAISMKQRVFTWGGNALKQLGIPDMSYASLPVEITSSFALMPDETFISVAKSANHTLMVTSYNRVFSFGTNSVGQLGIGSTSQSETIKEITYQFTNINQSIITVGATGQYAFAISESGKLFTFGGDQYNAFGFGEGVYIAIPRASFIREYKVLDVDYVDPHHVELLDLSEESGFKGWYLDDCLTTSYQEINPTIKTIDLFAKFSLTVQFDMGTEQAIPSIEVPYGSNMEVLPNIEKEGHLFKGWYLDNELTERVDYMTQNITVYPSFIEGSSADLEYTEGLIIRYINGNYVVQSFDSSFEERDIKIPLIYNDGYHGYDFVKHIGDMVFLGLDVDSITVPKSVQYIGNRAFSYLPHHTKIYFLGDAPLEVSESAFAQSYGKVYRQKDTNGWPNNYYMGTVISVIDEIVPLDYDFFDQIRLWNDASFTYADLMYHNPSIDWSKTLYTKDTAQIEILKEFSDLIVQDAQSDSEKVYMIYQWVSENIEYSFGHSTLSAYESYEQKKGVCSQYAMLINELSKLQGIPSLFITGYVHVGANSFEQLKEGNDQVETTNYHAINYVYVDNEWLILDATWGIYDMTRQDLDDYFYVDEIETVTYYVPGMDLTIKNGMFLYADDLIYIVEGEKISSYDRSFIFNSVLKFTFMTNKDSLSYVDDAYQHGAFVRNDWIIHQDATYYARFDGQIYVDISVEIDGYICTFDEYGVLVSKVPVDVNPTVTYYSQTINTHVYWMN
jgi:uncharacterized repeat protein (TIGR02543 family)